jgi:hypothetical protein
MFMPHYISDGSTAQDHTSGMGAATGSSPTKSITMASYSLARLGRGINWNMGPFDNGEKHCHTFLISSDDRPAVPIFSAINQTFALDKNVFNDLTSANLPRHVGEVPVGAMVLVGATCSFWKAGNNADPRLTFNLNWVIVIGVPK